MQDVKQKTKNGRSKVLADAASVNASASGSRGKGDGSDSDVTNTHIKAVNQLAMTSGGDTNIKGATASGKQVTANVGGNLNVESLQDSSQYKSQQQSLGGSISAGVGKVSGSISASRSKVDGNYQSVTEQSGILAGDDGFKVNVNGNTDLKGAKIASTDKAVADNKNSLTTASLTTSNIQNKSDYKAESQSFSAGGGYGGGNSSLNGTGIGFGKDSGSASSTTTSGVSGIAGDKTVRSDKDNSNALKKTWNGKELQQDVEAQAKIMETFGKEAAKGIGTYATSKLNALKDQIKVESDPAKKAALQNEAKNWDEGGVYRTTLHAAAGALGGGVGGALGATASSVAMPAIAEQNKQLDAPDAVKLALAQVAAAAIGAAVGGSAGLASSVSVEANNRQLHDTERQFAKDNAKKFAQYYKDKTGQTIDEKRAEQMLLGDGYRMVDAAANKGPGVAGPAGDAVAVSFLAQNAGSLFKATATERNDPGKLGAPLTSEQAALPGAVGNPALGLGTAAVITGGLAAPALLAIPGTPIFSSAGALGSGMWASPAGTAAISAGINAGAQYYQNGTINPVDVAVAAATGGAGAYGGFLWNVGVNAAGGAAGTAINNRVNGESNSVAGSAVASGALSSLGYSIGKLGESAVNSIMRPTINTPNWAASGSWNLFRQNNYAPIGGAVAGTSSQEIINSVQQQISSQLGGKK